MSKLLIFNFALILLFFEACQMESYPQGRRIYEAYCIQCHMADGTGLGTLYPDLSESTYLGSNLSDLPCLIITGKQSSQLATVSMPAHKTMKIAELTNLINYINLEWGNKELVRMDKVKELLTECP